MSHNLKQKPFFDPLNYDTSKESPISLSSLNLQILTKPQLRPLKTDLFQAETTINEQKYFKNSFMELQDNSSSFNVRILIEFTLYHMLFFMILGPFTALLIYFFYRKLTLARNLGFWGFNMNFILQMMIFLIIFISLLGFFYFKISIISPIEIISLIGGCLTRSFVIAIKYALFPEKKIMYLLHQPLTFNEIFGEFLVKWYQQDKEVITRELNFTLQRNNIEKDLFSFNFLRELTPELKLKIQEIEVQAPIKENELFSSTETLVSGYALSLYLLQANKKLVPIQFILLLCMFLSIIHGFLPVVFRITIDNESIFGSNSLEKFVTLCIFLGNIYFYFNGFMFVILGIFEYDRPIKLLSQLSNLLSIQKIEQYHIKKIFPTINIFCIRSFRSWYTLNLIVRDYGNRYLKRVDMHIGLFLIYYMLILVIFLISIYEFIPKLDSVYYVVLGYEMLIVLTSLFLIIYKGAIINEHFVLHQKLLIEIKRVIVDFLTLDPIYFENDYFTSRNQVYLLGKNTIEGYIKGSIGDNDDRSDREKREGHLESIISLYDMVMNQLAFQKEYYPFNFLGIPDTMATLQSLLAMVVSALTITFQKLLKF